MGSARIRLRDKILRNTTLHGTNFNTNEFCRYSAASAREKYLLDPAHATNFNIIEFRRYTSATAREKYLLETKFRMADRITQWWIDLKALPSWSRKNHEVMRGGW